MRISWITTAITIITASLLIGCSGGNYSNPASPAATPTVYRTGSVGPLGGTFNFPDIGISLYFPVGAIPDEEVFNFQIRAFPPNIPLLPQGRIYRRLGTFELVQTTGELMHFESNVDVTFPLAEDFPTGVTSTAFKLDEAWNWVRSGNAPVINEGVSAVCAVTGPGVYGAFEAVPLNVEATVSQQMGPVPLSVGVKAIVTGGAPPYQAVWYWGDTEDPDAGISNAHIYVDPGDYSLTVAVQDSDGNVVTDWVHLTCYAQAGPPAF